MTARENLMQKLRILFYTDHDAIIPLDRSVNADGLTDLESFIRHKTKGFLDVEITTINRHISLITGGPAQGANKLSWGLLSKFDELWVFGKKQINLSAHELKKAEPYNELDDHEVAVLGEWMNAGGGLLFTGDHSESNPMYPWAAGVEPPHATFITFGSALGSRIPRARQLRIWKGPPTNCIDEPRDNVNTQVQANPVYTHDFPALQYDEIPQRLLLPSSHQLFVYVNSKGKEVPIEVLPDHMHEGRVLVPDKLDDSWPKDSQLPIVVAKGTDKRRFPQRKEYDLVVAYDGHQNGVGRIVADSSFHHFVDRNLARIVGRECCGTPVPDTHLDQIAHFFRNLAIWLAPTQLRKQIINELPFRLAKHPDVLESHGARPSDLGRAARAAAVAEWGKANLHQLLGDSFLLADSEGFEDTERAGFLTQKLLTLSADSDLDEGLGLMIQTYHEFFRREQIYSPGILQKDPIGLEPIVDGVNRALSDMPHLAKKLRTPLQASTLSAKDFNTQTKEKLAMPYTCAPGTWDSWINADPTGERNDGWFSTDVPSAAGYFIGYHHYQGRPNLPIVGRCQSTPDRIEIERADSFNSYHRYFGIITRGAAGVFFVARGDGIHRHSSIPFLPLTEGDWALVGSESKLAADDDWTAEKTT